MSPVRDSRSFGNVERLLNAAETMAPRKNLEHIGLPPRQAERFRNRLNPLGYRSIARLVFGILGTRRHNRLPANARKTATGKHDVGGNNRAAHGKKGRDAYA